MEAEPVRVLIVSTTMDRGGAETLVMNVFRCLDRTKVMFDFVVHCNYRSAYEEEIEQLGGKIYRLPDYKIYNEFSYRRAFRNFFKSHPEYRIVHSHVNNTGAIFLDEANKCGLQTIAHSHCTSNGSGPGAWIRDLIKRNTCKVAKYRFACSEEAGNWLYRGKAPFTVIRNGIDSRLFGFNPDYRSQLRKELNIPEDAVVIGHVGRFDPVKNHIFNLQVFSCFVKKHPDSFLVLAGDGPLQHEIEKKVFSTGLKDRVIFTGSRRDVNRLYSAFDVFVFPSLNEGLPLTVIEAQCSGLPCVVSAHLTDEFEVTDLIHRIPLSDNPGIWANTIEQVLETKRKDRSEDIIKGGFDISETAKELQDFYISLC